MEQEINNKKTQTIGVNKKVFYIIVLLNFLLLGHLVTFSVINNKKISLISERANSISKIDYNKKIRLCDAYSKNELAKILRKEKETGKNIIKDRKKAFFNLNMNCLYYEGYNFDLSALGNNINKNVVNNKPVQKKKVLNKEKEINNGEKEMEGLKKSNEKKEDKGIKSITKEEKEKSKKESL